MTRWATRLSVTAPKEVPGGRTTRALWAAEPQAERAERVNRAERILQRRTHGRDLVTPLASFPLGSDAHRGNAGAAPLPPRRRLRVFCLWSIRPAPRSRPAPEQCSSARPRVRVADRSVAPGCGPALVPPGCCPRRPPPTPVAVP